MVNHTCHQCLLLNTDKARQLQAYEHAPAQDPRIPKDFKGGRNPNRPRGGGRRQDDRNAPSNQEIVYFDSETLRLFLIQFNNS